MRQQDKSLAELFSQLPSAADDNSGIGRAGQQFADAVQKRPDAPRALPLLLPYLKDSRSGVRNLAAYVIARIHPIDARYLEPLIDAERREATWLPSAIAEIGTPRAIDFLIWDLQRNPQVESQIGYSFVILGVKAVPALCTLLRQTAPANTNLLSAVAAILGRLKDDAKRTAIRPLQEIALNDRLPVANRQAAIDALGTLGPVAASAVPALQSLARRSPGNFARNVDAALASMQSPAAVPALLYELNHPQPPSEDRRYFTESFQRQLTMISIAQLGPHGRAAGPDLIRYLNDADWDLRRIAARALGFIDYQEAIPILIPLLRNVESWWLTWDVADALGRLQARAALDALQETASKHWYPPVRVAAHKAIDLIRRPTPVKFSSESRETRFLFLADERACPDIKTPPRPALHVESQLAVTGGTLVGIDRGEWGGSLEYQSTDGKKQFILSLNVHGVAPIGSTIVAVTGLAHLGFNYGDLYQIARNAQDVWSATRWRTLPGDPQWAQVRRKGDHDVLRVACLGGVINVFEDGRIQLVSDPAAVISTSS